MIIQKQPQCLLLHYYTNAMITTMSTTSLEDSTNSMTTIMSTITLDDHIDVVTTTMPTASLETNAETTIISTTSLDDITTTMSTTSLDNHADVVKTTVTIPTIADMTSTISLTTLASATNIEPIPYYAVGISALLVLFVGALAVLMLIFYVHKSQKDKNLRNSEPIFHHLYEMSIQVLLIFYLAYMYKIQMYH